MLAVVVLPGCASAVPKPPNDGSMSTATTRAVPFVAPVGFRAVTITVTAPDGTSRRHCVWLAATEQELQQGLQGVTDPELGGRSGMLFSFPDDSRVAFWMKDTVMPLSIAWFDAAGAFVSSADMEPCPAGTRSCPTRSAARPYRSAVEVPSGRLDELGLTPGSTLRLGEACA